jgi:hypothetical protein
VRPLGRRIIPSQGRYRTTQTQNKRTQTSMPWVAFEPTPPVFERAKPVHALDRAVTVIGFCDCKSHHKSRIHRPWSKRTVYEDSLQLILVLKWTHNEPLEVHILRTQSVYYSSFMKATASLDSSVGIIFFKSPQRQPRLWRPPGLLSNGSQERSLKG